MKKQILAVVFLLVSGSLFAQPQKGRLLIGAYFNGNYSKSETPEIYYSNSNLNTNASKSINSTFEVSPNVNYFITDKSSIGFGLIYGNTTYSKKDNKADTLTSENITNTFGLKLNYNKYYSLRDKIYLTLENSLYSNINNLNYPKYEYSNTTDINTKNFMVGYKFSPGLMYFATNRLVLSTTFSFLNVYFSNTRSEFKAKEYNNPNNSTDYTYIPKTESKTSFGINAINFTSLTSVTIGAHYYIGKKANANTN